MKDKTLAVYEVPNDPTGKDITHVALRIDFNPVYVSGAYKLGDELPPPSDDQLVMPKEEADGMFYYRKCRIDDGKVILE